MLFHILLQIWLLDSIIKKKCNFILYLKVIKLIIYIDGIKILFYYIFLGNQSCFICKILSFGSYFPKTKKYNPQVIASNSYIYNNLILKDD